MRNYSSAKAVCEKFKDDLIGSNFTVLTDNNPLTYIRTSLFRCYPDLAGCPISHCLTLRSSTEPGNPTQAADALSQ